MENFKQGQHLGQGEIKAMILWQILKGHRNESDLKADIRKEASLKNNRDVIYHLFDKRYGLQQEGLIKRRTNGIELTVKDSNSLVNLCLMLFSNHEIALQLLPSFETMRDMAFTFIQNKDQFIYEIQGEAHKFLHENYSADVKRFNDQGEDPVKIFTVCQTKDEFKDNIELILHVIESNLVLDGYLKEGITDPPYVVHGEFYATGLRGMKKTRGYEMGYFPIEDPNIERRAVKEFIEGILERSALGEAPSLSMLMLTPEKEGLISLIDRAEMKLNSLRYRATSEIASLMITKERK